eukprot:8111376-Pyramimonas_sp.AAC.1
MGGAGASRAKCRGRGPSCAQLSRCETCRGSGRRGRCAGLGRPTRQLPRPMRGGRGGPSG